MIHNEHQNPPDPQHEERLFAQYRSRAETDGMDETERLRLERDFWRSLYQRLLAVRPEPALTVDIDGHPSNWNRATEASDGPATGTT